jgi:chromosome segregation ATPase
MRAAVRELQRVCGVFQKDITYCQKQGKLVSGFERKINENRCSLMKVLMTLDGINDQIINLQDQTDTIAKDIPTQLKNIEEDISKKMEKEKQIIFSNVGKTVQDRLDTQYSSITQQIENISRILGDVQYILETNGNDDLRNDNQIYKINKEIEILKDKAVAAEKSIGEASTCKSAIMNLGNYTGPSDIMNFLKKIADEVFAIKNHFVGKAVMENTISEIKENISEALQPLETFDQDLQGLIEVLGKVTSEDVTNLKNFESTIESITESIVSQSVDKYVESITFSKNITSICQTIIQILIGQIVPELINGTINEMLGAAIPTKDDINNFMTEVKNSVKTTVTTKLEEMGFKKVLEKLQEDPTFLSDIDGFIENVGQLQNDISGLKNLNLEELSKLKDQLEGFVDGTALEDLQDEISKKLENLPDIKNLVTKEEVGKLEEFKEVRNDVDSILEAVGELKGLKDIVSTTKEVQEDVDSMLKAVGADGFEKFVNTSKDVQNDVDSILEAVGELKGLKDIVSTGKEVEEKVKKQKELIDEQDKIMEEQKDTIKDMNSEIDQLEKEITSLTNRLQAAEANIISLTTKITSLLNLAGVSEPTLKSTSTRG